MKQFNLFYISMFFLMTTFMLPITVRGNEIFYSMMMTHVQTRRELEAKIEQVGKSKWKTTQRLGMEKQERFISEDAFMMNKLRFWEFQHQIKKISPRQHCHVVLEIYYQGPHQKKPTRLKGICSSDYPDYAKFFMHVSKLFYTAKK
ncbi:MAG: hypothetical protein HY390_02835 [Deltaproteobacteria bacterium]|nr:hypothetical protein [Deltaproteobacteria bacterium]